MRRMVRGRDAVGVVALESIRVHESLPALCGYLQQVFRIPRDEQDGESPGWCWKYRMTVHKSLQELACVWRLSDSRSSRFPGICRMIKGRGLPSIERPQRIPGCVRPQSQFGAPGICFLSFSMASHEIGLALCMDCSMIVLDNQGGRRCGSSPHLEVGIAWQGNHASGG